MAPMTAPEPPNSASHRVRRRTLAHALARRFVVSLVVAGIAPVVTYLIARPRVESTAVALALAFAVPVAWAGASGLWRQRLDLDGSLTIGAYGLSLVVTILSGGSALPLKLHAAAETGAVGVACLVSVVLRRPLVLLGLRLLARRGRRRPGSWLRAIADPAVQRAFSVVTVLIGVGLLVEAASQVAMALVLPTLVFVAVSLPARFLIYGSGAGLFLALRSSGAKSVRALLTGSSRHGSVAVSGHTAPGPGRGLS